MAALNRKLSTGNSMVFDKDTRTLYVADPGETCTDVQSAEALVKAGKAKKYDKAALETLQAALGQVVLLGA